MVQIQKLREADRGDKYTQLYIVYKSFTLTIRMYVLKVLKPENIPHKY